MTDTRDDEYLNPLDLVVFMAENWIVLVVPPLLVAVGVFFWAGAVPPTYSATIPIRVPTISASTPPIDTRGFHREALAPREGVETKLTRWGVRVTGQAESKERAAELALAAHDDVAGALILEFERRLETSRSLLDRLEPTIERLENIAAADPLPPSAVSEALEAIAPYHLRFEEAVTAIARLQNPRDISTSRDGLTRSRIAFIAGLATFMSIFFGLMLHRAVHNALQSENNQAKLRRIQRALVRGS